MKAWAKTGRLLLIAVMVVGMISFPLPARATGPFLVNSTSDLTDANPGDGACAASDGLCTLRAAIMEANALAGPDAITVPAGTYTLTLHGPAENGDLDITSDLTITGAGSANTVVMGDTTWDDRIIQIVQIVGATVGSVSISGLTIKGGHAPASENGGGMEGSAGTVTLADMIFSDNTAGFNGGGLWVGSVTTAAGPGDVMLTGIRATHNSAQNDAGGLGVVGNGTLSGIMVSNNTAGVGGGGIELSGTGTLTDFIVADNTAGQPGSAGSGGGVVADGAPTQPWLLSNGKVSGNHSEGQGGGVATSYVTVEDVWVDNNSAAFGGGISNVAGFFTLRRVTVSDNTETVLDHGFGAGVHDQGGNPNEHQGASVEMENVTISHNQGGGFDSNSLGGRLVNVTIADNESGYGIVVGFSGSTYSLQGVIVTGPYTCYDYPGGPHLVSLGGNLEYGSKNGDSCPAEVRADPMLAPLADNGGPVPTRALLPGSPAIDTMPTGICPPPATDERGIGYTRPQGPACDIGAYEFSPIADLAVSQRDDRDPIAVGESVTYTVTVDNHGPSVANGVTLTDTLPAGTTLVSATATAGGSCTPGSGAVTCVWSTVAANPTSLPTVAVQVAANNPGTIINSATVTATGGPPDPTPANNTSMESTTVTGQRAADLEITKSAPATAIAGAAAGFDYGLTVLNHGQFDEPSFTVTDMLPAGVSLVNTSPGCSANANTIQCTGGPLAAGATAAFTIHVQVPASVAAGTVLNNQASVTGSLPDPNAANNSAAATTTVATRADLGLGKALSTPIGTQATYELTITTSGPSDGAGVLVSDLLPADLAFVSADQGGMFDPQTRTVTWNLGTVPPSSQPILLHLTIQFDPQRTAPVSNTACVASATQDPAAGNDCSTVTSEVVADLRVDKTAPTSAVAGDPAGFDYHVTVSNAGPLAQAFTVTDPLPAVLTFVRASAGCGQASGTVTCAGGPLAAGDSASFDIHVRVPASVPDGTILHNLARVAGQATDSNPSNNQADTTTTVVSRADLSVTKRGPDLAGAGTQIQYEIAVVNGGPSDASGVLLTDQIPDGTTFVAADQGGTFDQQRGQVNWSLGTITASAPTLLLHLTVRVAPDRAAALSNTACASSATSPTAQRCATVTTPVTSTADVSVLQTAPANIELGDPFAVTATVANNGPSTATGVILTETLQPHLEFVGVQPCGTTVTVATCQLGSLTPGGSQTITFHLRGVLSCTSTLTGGSGNDTLVGTGGSDTICGGAGDDTISGGNGDDHLYGYGPAHGEDLVEIVSGQTASPDPTSLNNTARTTTHVKGALEAAPDRDKIDGGPGNDFISGDYGSDTLNGGPGDDQIWGDVADPAPVRPPMFPPDDQLPSPSNNFSDPVCSQPGDLSQSTSDGGDTINGIGGSDEIHGQGGNDGGGKRIAVNGELEGGGGRDHICGGFGNDHLDGGPDSRNILNGGGDEDWCSGGPKPGDYWISCQKEKWGWNGKGR